MTNSPDFERSVGFLIKEISRLFTRDFDERVRDHGLTQTQWQALLVLSRMEGINQSTLADLLRIKPMSLCRLIDRMEAAGWVERRRAPQDRRTIQLYPTPKVRPLLNQLEGAAALTRESALSGFDSAERQQFFSMLERVRSNLRPDSALALEPAPEQRTNHR